MRKKKLLDGLRETRRFWKLKEKALDRSVCGELALEEALYLSYDRPGGTVRYQPAAWSQYRIRHRVFTCLKVIEFSHIKSMEQPSMVE
jgi:hypothetical protein